MGDLTVELVTSSATLMLKFKLFPFVSDLAFVFVGCVTVSVAKPVVKDVVEEGEAKYHFMYVCTKTIPI